MIENIKPMYHNFLKPFSSILLRLGIHPNILTVSGVLFFGIGGWLLILGYWKTSVLVTIAGGFLDGLDGVLARESGKISKFGGILDSVCDRFTEIIWFGCLIVYFSKNTTSDTQPMVIYLAFIAITGSIMVSYVRARAEGAGIECKKGILQRPERLIILGSFQFLGPDYIIYGLIIVAVVSYMTVFQRIYIAYINSKN